MTGPAPSVRGKGPPPDGVHVLDRLFKDGRIAEEQYREAYKAAQRTEERVEEALIAIGALSELELLKRLAETYRTQFVSTEKLAKANIDRHLLDLVPKKLAERLGIFPVVFKKRTGVLSIVAYDHEQHDVAKQVQLVASVRSVKVYVARPAAIEAAIRKHYYRDARAFAQLLRAKMSEPPPVGTDLGGGSFGGVASDIAVGGFDGGFDPFSGLAPSTSSKPKKAEPPPPPDFVISAPELAEELKAPASSNLTSPSSPPPATGTHSFRPPSTPPVVAQGPTAEEYLETLHVMVALLEQSRDELRSHSAQVARLAKKMCDRIGLSGAKKHEVVVAAYLHDVGKASNYHLTALNVARYEGHKIQAQKTYLAPIRLFETTRLPEATRLALKHLYERFDGAGFPDRLTGKDVPMGARILAVVETYADLTAHAKNPYRQRLTPAQACEAVKGFEGKIFDPTLCDVLRHVVLGDVKSKLLAERRTVLLVDSDPEDTTILDMRFSAAGFDVIVARDVHEAGQRLGSGLDVVVTEVDLPDESGFELLRMVQQRRRKTPVVVLTRRGDRESINRGFELGAADYLVKPTPPDVVVAKASQLVERASSQGARGVSGSLREMSLPDVVQILSNGRKSGRLIVEADGERGEVHFRDGDVWDAAFGSSRGEEGFYRMLLLNDGEFQLEPGFIPETRRIQAQTESLLLEGMRRLDEGMR